MKLWRQSAPAAVLLLAAGVAGAAAPITLTDVNTEDNPLIYTAGPFLVRTAEAGCDSGLDLCDDTELTIQLSDEVAANHRVTVRLEWGEPIQADFDLFIESEGASIASSASTTDPEIARFSARNGVYNIHVDPYQPFGNSIEATVYLEALPAPGSVTPGPVAGFQIFAPPSELGATGGEPSIGANWKTGRAIVGNSSDTFFIDFDDSTTPATASWANRPPYTNLISFDPILWTDRESGHTVVSQLVSDVVLFSNGCSLSSYSTDDGETWIPAEGCGIPSGADHQALGGGPYSDALPIENPLYPFAVYYCAQAFGVVIGDATCARSDDGGLTYAPSTIVYTSECGGLHGHPRVAPDGTVYLPNKACSYADGLGQGVALSKDNGLTWTISVVPGSQPGESDPSVATGLNDTGKPATQTSNTVYLGYCDGDGRPKVATSPDQGQTWSAASEVGASANIANCAFPEMIAGDDNRASFFFLGTPTPGDYQAADFDGEWHGYVATTYDGGLSWGLADATPDDPVQIGCIWQQGGSNPCRNLLDFNDITLDEQGRPLFVFADGCLPSNGCTPGASPETSRSALDTVGRQSSCLTLFAEYDKSIGAKACSAPAVSMPLVQTPTRQTLAVKGGAIPLWLLVLLSSAGVVRKRRSTRPGA